MKTHFIAGSFRSLTDEQVAHMQFLMIDDQQPVKDVAKDAGVSAVTAYRVRSAVPIDLCTVDELAVRRWRNPRRKRRARKTG